MPSAVFALEKARAAWPNLKVQEEDFLGWLADRDVEADLIERNAGDLLLAWACARGDQSAMTALEQLYFREEIDAPSRRNNVPSDDIRQRVRTKLFVGPEPKIGSYAGRSSLRTWLRAVIGRIMIDVSRERPRDLPAPEEHFKDLVSEGDDPDRLLLKESYRTALEEAFSLAAERLSDRDKNLLRYGLSEGLSIDQIGKLYGVHRVTAHRWLQQARAAFVEQIQALMMERLRMSPSEFNSVLRLVISRIDITIARVFAG